MSEKKVDYLSEDPVISYQKYCLVSFLERKTDFEIENKDYNLQSVETINEILKDAKMDPIDVKDNQPNIEQLNRALVELVVNTREKYITGTKIRGSYEKIEDAKTKAQELQKMDSTVGIFVGEVGKWLPFNPNADAITEQEYSNDKLNDLMKGHKENQAKAKYYFEQRKQELIQKNIEENEILKIQNKQKQLINDDFENTIENNITNDTTVEAQGDDTTVEAQGDDTTVEAQGDDTTVEAQDENSSVEEGQVNNERITKELMNSIFSDNIPINK